MAAGFVPAHSFITAPSARPYQWALVLHGIFGRGANWRTFARRLCERRPELGLVLVDLRAHGDSRDAPPPHTVQTAADDLVRLAAALAADGRPVRGVAGHSLGGKVALLYAARAPEPLAQVWVFDSDPGVSRDGDAGGGADSVLRALEAAPLRYPSREAFVTHMTDAGFSLTLAQWLAMNLDREDQGLRMGLDVQAMRSLMTSYRETDVFDVVAQPPAGCELRFVLGGASDSVSEGSRDRLGELARVDVLEGAGHWLHVDALDALVDVVANG